MFTNKIPWIILLVLWMIGSTWWHVCKIKQLCADDAPPVQTTLAPPTAALPALTISDGDRFRLNWPGNFSFAKSGADANMGTIGGSLDSLTAYLKSNPGRVLEVTGYYAATETNPTSFANLGLARAEGVKEYLIKQGIPAVSLTTKGVLRDDLVFTPAGDSLYGGLGFSFFAKPVATPKNEQQLAEAQKYTSVLEPLDLYFPLGKSDYIKTGETTKFFNEAVTYLAANKDKKLVLTGHTDNTGSDELNLRLSRNRANEVKAKLRQTGIRPDRIVVVAKGETEPKASNDTSEGRRANRRVSVVIQ